jgi:hypothetical protein
MNLRKSAALLALVGIVCCKPIEDGAVDPKASYDNGSIRVEDFVFEGKKEPTRDGVRLIAPPTFRGQETSSNNSRQFKNFPEFEGLETGTAAIKFQMEKFSEPGFRFIATFATGMGLPVDVRVTQSTIFARCGSLPSASYAFEKNITINDTHELRIVREETDVNIVFDKNIVISNLTCLPVQNPYENPRTSGYVQIKLYSQNINRAKTNQDNTLGTGTSTMLVKNIQIYQTAELGN